MPSCKPMKLFSGKFVDPWVLTKDDIKIADIAHSLSNQCRWGGHVQKFYSVAEHCVRVCNLSASYGSSKYEQLSCLLHDATEAYITDLPRPVKWQLLDYCVLEDQIAVMINEVFGVDICTPHVKGVDQQMCAIEARDLMGIRNGEWEKFLPEPLECYHIYSTLSPEEVRAQFYSTYINLTEEIARCQK